MASPRYLGCVTAPGRDATYWRRGHVVARRGEVCSNAIITSVTAKKIGSLAHASAPRRGAARGSARHRHLSRGIAENRTRISVYGVRPSRTYSFEDHLGRVRGTKSKIEDGYAEGT